MNESMPKGREDHRPHSSVYVEEYFKSAFQGLARETQKTSAESGAGKVEGGWCFAISLSETLLTLNKFSDAVI